MASTIVVTYDGLAITDHVQFADSTFDAQMAAMPGTFSILVRDVDQTMSFVTGRELTIDVDGVRMFGGWIFQVQKKFAFPTDDTVTAGVASVRTRQWLLTGTDYNTLFDRRVLRSDGDPTLAIPDVSGTITDGGVIRDWFPSYFDIPTGFDFSDTAYVLDNHTFIGQYAWMTQGAKMREVLDNLALYGSVYFIDANKKLHFVPIQQTASDWGFSDVPNNLTLAAASSGSVTATVGFRDGEMTEDATAIVNDALVWGGSEWASSGDIVFAERENASSIADHGRWQLGEVHVGDANYKNLTEVTARAKVIVDGNESGTFAEGSKGLVNPEKQFKATWFAHQTPSDGTHLLPGFVVPIELWVFSDDGGVTPFSMNLPLRQISVSFPTLQDATGEAYVQFSGTFGVLMSDPWWLWSYLRGLRNRSNPTIVTADNGTTNAMFGSFYQDVPSPATNGVVTIFTIPFAYVPGTAQVYKDRLLVTKNVDYTESNPATGQITFTTAPTGSLWVVAILAAG